MRCFFRKGRSNDDSNGKKIVVISLEDLMDELRSSVVTAVQQALSSDDTDTHADAADDTEKEVVEVDKTTTRSGIVHLHRLTEASRAVVL